jgi:hypothetical protein
MQQICDKYAKICNVCEYRSSMRICKKYAQNMQEYAIYAIMILICRICKNMHSPLCSCSVAAAWLRLGLGLGLGVGSRGPGYCWAPSSAGACPGQRNGAGGDGSLQAARGRRTADRAAQYSVNTRFGLPIRVDYRIRIIHVYRQNYGTAAGLCFR